MSQAEQPQGIGDQIRAGQVVDGITGVAGLAAGQVLPGPPRSPVVGAIQAAAVLEGELQLNIAL